MPFYDELQRRGMVSPQAVAGLPDYYNKKQQDMGRRYEAIVKPPPVRKQGGSTQAIKTLSDIFNPSWLQQSGVLPPPVQKPGIEDILAELARLQDPSRYLNDPAFQAQIRSSIAAQYDPQINELRRLMMATQTRAGKQKTELGQLFGALSESLSADLPTITRTYQDTQKQAASEYAELQNNLKQGYAESQKSQEELFKRLNIEAAAPDVFPQQQRDLQFFQNLEQQEQQGLRGALTRQQKAAEDYTRQGAQIARMEGTNRQADLMEQLRAVLTEYEGKIGEVGSAKEAAYQTALGQTASSQAQRDYQTYKDMINLERMLTKDQASAAGKTSTRGLSGASSFIQQNANNAGLVQRALDETLKSSEVRSGQQSPGMRMTPEEAASLAYNNAKAMGANESDAQAAYTAMLIYYGRY